MLQTAPGTPIELIDQTPIGHRQGDQTGKPVTILIYIIIVFLFFIAFTLQELPEDLEHKEIMVVFWRSSARYLFAISQSIAAPRRLSGSICFPFIIHRHLLPLLPQAGS